MAIYRNKYVLDGLDEIPSDMLKDLDLAYDLCRHLHDTFPCEMCGKCCHQANIMVLDEEVGRIAKRLGTAETEFEREYLYRENGRWLFKKSDACRFLRKDRRCRIWSDRPQICRDFPYLVSKFMSRVYLSIVNDVPVDLSYMEDDWPCTPIIKSSVGDMIEEAKKKRKERITRSL